MRPWVVVYIPAWMKGGKRILLESVARADGAVSTVAELEQLPASVVPWVCCAAELADIIAAWRASGREFIYWDRGYVRRLGGVWLPTDSSDGYYRCHRNAFQMARIRDVPGDRWEKLNIDVLPWHRGRAVVVAGTASDYWRLHKAEGWIERTVHRLKSVTDRPIVVRGKDSRRPLAEDLKDAHCLVAHGSNAAVEAVLMGCAVCVDPVSAAALVGITDVSQIEAPVYPDRQAWMHSLAYSQFTQRELLDGTLWDLIE